MDTTISIYFQEVCNSLHILYTLSIIFDNLDMGINTGCKEDFQQELSRNNYEGIHLHNSYQTNTPPYKKYNLTPLLHKFSKDLSIIHKSLNLQDRGKEIGIFIGKILSINKIYHCTLYMFVG